MRFFLSLILGMLPEVLYFTLFMIYSKNIRDKKKRLFIGFSIIYILCVLINNYKTVYYFCFIFLNYLWLKILYKDRTLIIDIFVFNISFMYLTLVSFVCSLFVKSLIAYIIMYILNRILLFLPFTFKEKFNVLYKKYCNLWNRNYEKKQPIKSITLRNISLISLNTFIFLSNVFCLYILNLKG